MVSISNNNECDIYNKMIVYENIIIIIFSVMSGYYLNTPP